MSKLELMEVFDKDDYSEKVSRRLFKSLQDLNTIQTHLFECVESQDEKIDSIQANIISTDTQIERGTEDLIEAQKYSFKYSPILIGFLVGGLSMSPIGMLINIKLGSLFTLGGGVLGGYTGYKIQK
mgnify:CR=1 FL=1